MSKRRLITGSMCLLVVGGMVAVSQASRGGEAPSITPEQAEDMRSGRDEELPNASQSQRLALADGVVDRSEMQMLGEKVSDCSVANGSNPIQLDVGSKSVQWGVSFHSNDDTDALSTITEKCWDEHIGLAERYYSLQNIAPVSEQVRINKSVADCLASEGYEAPGWPATDAKIDPAVESECVDLAEKS